MRDPRRVNLEVSYEIFKNVKCCADHCTTHALSVPSEKTFQRLCKTEDDVNYKSCPSLENLMQKITAEIDNVPVDEEQKSRMRHEFKQYVEAINAWKARHTYCGQ